MEDKNLIGQRIKDARECLGLTQVELAEKLGVSFQSIQQWEAGKTQPRSTKMRKLANILRLTPVYIQFGVGSPSSEMYDGLPLIQSEDFRNQLYAAHDKAFKACVSLGWISMKRTDVSLAVISDILYSKLLEEYGLSADDISDNDQAAINE